jgi:hypothetical protein
LGHADDRLPDSEPLDASADFADRARNFPTWHVWGLWQTWVVPHIAATQQDVDESDCRVRCVNRDLSWARLRIRQLGLAENLWSAKITDDYCLHDFVLLQGLMR